MVQIGLKWELGPSTFKLVGMQSLCMSLCLSFTLDWRLENGSLRRTDVYDANFL